VKVAATVSLVPEARGGPFVFWEDLALASEKAQRLGFDAIEIFPPAASAVDAGNLSALLEDHNLKLAAIGTGGGWVKRRLTLTSSDANVRREAGDFVRSIIDAAGALGAPTIIGSMQGRWGDGVSRDNAIGWLSEALNDLGEHARTLRVPLLYEPLNRYETNMVNVLSDGIALVQSLSTRNVRLLADLYHMNIEEADLAVALRETADLLGHVHLADSNRRPAGDGHTDFGLIADALRGVGYDGYLSAECFPWPDPDSAAEQTMRAFRRYFAG
jgi:sugar phosphate isomerase/epimerase